MILVGCSGDGLSSHEYDDVAAIAASSIASPQRGGTLGAIEDSLSIARGELPKGFVVEPDGIVRGTRGAITYRYQVLCQQPWFAACDPPAGSAVVRAWWDGELAMSAFAGPVHREAIWRINGLTTEMALVTGTATGMEQQAAFPDGDAYHVIDTQDQMMFADMPGRDMRGGAVTAALTVETADGQFEIAAEMSLDGSEAATLVLDGTHEYVVDLATGDVQ